MLTEANRKLGTEVDHLGTPEGAKEAARDELGVVGPGEERISVLPTGGPRRCRPGGRTTRHADRRCAGHDRGRPAPRRPLRADDRRPLAGDRPRAGRQPHAVRVWLVSLDDAVVHALGHQGVHVAGSILGNRVLRKEDPKFLTTGGEYVDDLLDEPLLAGAAARRRTCARRSPTATITGDRHRRTPLEMPGVVAVYTAADLGLEPVPVRLQPDGRPRHCSRATRSASSASPSPSWSPRPARQARTPPSRSSSTTTCCPRSSTWKRRMASSTLIYDGAGTNAVFDTTVLGMPENTGEAFFAGCEVVVTGRFVNQRVAPCPLEVRGSAVAWVDGRLHQWISHPGTPRARRTPIAAANGVERRRRCRVITPDVGGGFGAKIGSYPEELLLGVRSPSSSAGRCAGARPAASR